ncbi:MAG: amino acid adenylation domain-containing protein [Chloroflexi bacterium]|nr:amino acid adenylation domain-containing protein [Chloroflexota bacterium]
MGCNGGWRPAAGGILDFRQPARALERLSRALNYNVFPNPLALPKLVTPAEVLVARRARVAARGDDAAPGTVLGVDLEGLCVACGEDAVDLGDLFTSDGVSLTGTQAARRLGVQIGDRLPLLGDETLHHLTRLVEHLASHEQWWRHRLNALIVPPSEHAQSPRPPHGQHAMRSVDVTLDVPAMPADTAALELSSTFAALLIDRVQRDEFDIGYSHPELRLSAPGGWGLVSEFVPLRIAATPGGGVAAISARLGKELEAAHSHEGFVRDLGLRLGHRHGRDLAPAPFWRLAVIRHRGEAAVELPRETELALVIDDARPYQCQLHASPDVMGIAELNELADAFRQRLASLHSGPPRATGSGRGEPEAHPAEPRTALELIAAVCKRNGTATAVQFEDTRLSYAALDALADATARALVEHGVRPGEAVGLLTERSALMVAGVLGILRAGGAFVPLDPGYPVERLRLNLQASNARVALVTPGLTPLAAELGVVVVELRVPRASTSVNGHPLPTIVPDSLAYIIFTSGSTGVPKGVEVEHGALVNLLRSMQRTPGLSAHDTLLAVTTISFDIAILELLLPLVTGARLVIAPRETARSAHNLSELIHRCGATVMQATPVTWRMLLQVGWQPRTPFKILCGGEAMGRALAERLLETGAEVWNLYGPTEATIWASAHRVLDVAGGVPIGEPVTGTELFVLRDDLIEASPGEEGELYIGGRGLARGYTGRPEVTAAAFVAHPRRPGQRLYRTGDLVQLRPDGAIEWIGRRDQQIKIRGHRIEIGEIERALESDPSIAQAVVVARADSNAEEEAPKRLVAYVKAASADSLERAALVAALEQRLPAYMIPSVFVQIDEFPTTPNGKVDRNALSAPRRDNVVTDRPAQPAGLNTTRLQELLCALYQDVLGIDQVRAEDNFFVLGGDSLLVEELFARLERHVQSPVHAAWIFAAPTPRQLAQQLHERISAAPHPSPAAPPRGTAPLPQRTSPTAPLPQRTSPTAPLPQRTSPTAPRLQAPPALPARAAASAARAQDIAIVGIGCRFPGSRTPDEFWENLRAGRDLVREIDPGRAGGLELARNLDPGVLRTYGRWQGWLEDAEHFDPDYFGISRREARRMDPLQRLFAMVSAEAAMSAGYAPREIAGGRVAVYAGVIATEHAQLLLAAGQIADAHAASGAAMSMIANRVSFLFGWHGPSMVLDTACSSSLVALHLACRGLRAGEYDAAAVGGVNLVRTPSQTVAFGQAGMLSADGRCRAFDARANGYVRGEGAGAVLVKRLADALRDGDPVLALVKGTAVNHDGGHKGFLTAPNLQAQVDVLREAWRDGGVDPGTLGYIEAHGTGTALGDPIEIEALTEAFGPGRSARCAIGSVKSSIGHLEPAAGIAGVIKTVMALQARQLPPTLHVERPNPRIDFEASPFFICDRLIPWERDDGPRRAGVSSFGFGGTNAHVVLEEAPARPVIEAPAPYLLTISARSREGLRALAERYRSLLRQPSSPDAAALAASSNRAAERFAHRFAALISSAEQLDDKLTLFLTLPDDDLSTLRSVFVGPVGPPPAGQAAALLREGERTLAEESLGVLRRCLGRPAQPPGPAAPLPDGQRAAFLALLGRAFAGSLAIDWSAIDAPCTRVRLPTVPMEEIPCGVELKRPDAQATAEPPETAGARRARFAPQSALIQDHRIFNTAVVPGAAIIAAAADALAAATGRSDRLQLQQIILHRAVRAQRESPIDVKTWIEPADDRILRIRVALAARSEAGPIAQMQADTAADDTAAAWEAPEAEQFSETVDIDALYQAFARAGLTYGPQLRTVAAIRRRGREVLGRLRRPPAGDGAVGGALLDPRLLDGALQCALAGVLDGAEPQLYVPFYVEQLRRSHALGQDVQVYARTATANRDSAFVRGDVTLFDEHGPALELRGIVWKRVSRGDLLEQPVSEPTAAVAFRAQEHTPAVTEQTAPQDIEAAAQDAPARPGSGLEGVREALHRWVSEALEVPIDDLDLEAPLFEQGLDSMLAVQLAQTIQERIGVTLPPTILLEVGTVSALARELVEVHGFTGPVPRPEAASGAEGCAPAEDAAPAGPAIESAVESDGWLLDQAVSKPADDRIAIVGMDGIFPMAGDVDELWENLRSGRDCVQTVPASRWNVDDYYSPDADQIGRIYARWGGFVETVDEFDPQFFRIPPADAQWIDPQQRQLLQVAWRAIERAGLRREELAAARTGVFVGASYTHYRDQTMGDVVQPPAGLGNHNAILANRISYFLDLTGPCFTIDTLCSSSLVALHLAMRSLRSNECDYALVAAAHLDLSPQYYQMACRLRAFSPGGRCRTFDNSADGFIPGEGVVVLVLKRLDAAQRDHDPIHGVLLGSAVNHGGRTSGLTVPSSTAQAAVIRAAFGDAHINAASLSYIEAHGTGTALGDPIEIDGLTTAFHPDTTKRQFCAIGSVKTNLGHLEPAAGLAGVLKVLLALHHEQLPPSLHLQHANPRIDFAASPFYVTDRLQPWPRTTTPRRAGVSAFGMGGVNAHVVLEEAPLRPTTPATTRPVELLRLSAHTPEALHQLATAYVHTLRQPSAATDLPHLVHTANRSRANLRYRAAVVGADPTELAEALAPLASGAVTAGRRAAQRPKLAFLFTGQGSQYVGMASGLAAVEPVAKASLAESAAAVADLLPVPLETLLSGAGGQALEQTRYAQVAIAAVEWALVELLASWGVRPDLVLGHSLGEYAAAAAAGVFAWPDALRLIARRAQLMQACPADGAMVALRADGPTVQAALADHGDPRVEVAALNSPRSTVVSGPADAVRAFVAAAGLPSQPLRVSHAFHSAAMGPAADAVAEAVATTPRHAPRLPLGANLTGGWHTPASAVDPAYWAAHLRQPVRFAAGIRALWDAGARTFWELGPRPDLTVLGQHVLGSEQGVWLTTVRPKVTAHRELLTAVARYYSLGLGDIDWAGMEAGLGRHTVPLPTYPFQRQRYRAESARLSGPVPPAAEPSAPDPLFAHPLFAPADSLAALSGAGSQGHSDKEHRR